jgi:hypothetical protein
MVLTKVVDVKMFEFALVLITLVIVVKSDKGGTDFRSEKNRKPSPLLVVESLVGQRSASTDTSKAVFFDDVH